MKIKRPTPRQIMSSDAVVAFKGKIFDVYQWQQLMYDGSYQTFEKLKRPDTAIVIAVTEDKNIILIKQDQPGKKTNLGFPGGRLEENEDVIVAAQRELEEETGYTSSNFTVLKAIAPYSKIDWVLYFLIAKNCTKVNEQRLDAGEKISINLISFEEMIELLINEQIEEEPELTNIALKAKVFPEEMEKLRKMILD